METAQRTPEVYSDTVVEERAIPVNFLEDLPCRSELLEIVEESLYRYGKVDVGTELPSAHIERAIAALTQILAIDKETEADAESLRATRHMYLTKDRRIAWTVL